MEIIIVIIELLSLLSSYHPAAGSGGRNTKSMRPRPSFICLIFTGPDGHGPLRTTPYPHPPDGSATGSTENDIGAPEILKVLMAHQTYERNVMRLRTYTSFS